MSHTFDSVIKVPTRVALGNDAFSPGMGALGPGSETEQALIHGNQKEQVFGNHDRYVSGTTTIVLTGAVKIFMMSDCLWTVLGNTTINFLSNYRLLVAGTTTATYMGTVINTFLAANINNHVGPRIGSHASPNQNLDPTSWIDVVANTLKLESVKQTIGVYKCDVFGAAMSFSGVKVDCEGAKGAVQLTELRTAAQKVKAEAAKTKAEGLEADLNGLKSQLGALEAKVESRLDALPTASTSAPFGA
jgi:hypothetical protein